MPVISVDKTLEKFAQAKDPRRAIKEAVGDLTGLRLRADQVLVGIYIRPEKTAGGIIRPPDNLKEDQYQGKVGLVLKLGPDAHGIEPELALETGWYSTLRMGGPATATGFPAELYRMKELE